MAKYIEREAVMQAFSDFVWNSNHSDLVPAPTWNHAVEIVRDIPAADVVEVRHAKFMPTKNFSGLKCSACGARVKNGAWRTHNWCYACGAKMDGGTDDGKAD